uniref:M superfamily MMSK group conopeptide Lt1C01 n=1 Tax=Conus litteratus TaxID=89445 RepID=H2BKI4_CONLT|nr:M superfamily MMSK group conopeptide Lt1C01 [Conus litteratus]
MMSKLGALLTICLLLFPLLNLPRHWSNNYPTPHGTLLKDVFRKIEDSPTPCL